MRRSSIFNMWLAGITVVTLCVMAVGCATLNQYENVGTATYEKRNLVGLTRAQIEEMFGRPEGYNVSYDAYGTTEILNYSYASMVFPYGTRRMMIFLRNGIVTNVSYY